jgi:acyl-CoA synthetase (AMP-forming)/AMP-acid ligase II
MEFQLADLFDAVVDTVPDAEALVCGAAGVVTVRRTYAELDDRVSRAANALAALGAGPGSHVGIDLFNGPEWIEVMLALFRLGATPVNVNHRYTAEELAYLFADADLTAVVTAPELVPAVEQARAAVPEIGHVVTIGPDYEARLAAAATTRPAPGARPADDLYLIYTGGTTGMPKGVMWRHEDIYFASLGGRGTPSRGVPALGRPEDIVDRVRRGDPIMRRLPLCPLMHGGAQWVALQALLTGGALVLDTDHHFDADHALALLAGERVELTMLIGDATARPLTDALERDPGRYDLSALQVIASGGAILSPSVRDHLRALLPGVAVVDTFGASETGGQGRLTGARPGAPPRLVADDRTVVLDDDLRPVAPGDGTVGRVASRGWIPYGYYKDPERTAATFPVIDGVRWSVPGDRAVVEADGSITLLGRGAMSINTGGEKVFPEEVEAVVKAHPSVFDALVVGVPDERFGQRVVAVVAMRPGADPVDDEALRWHVREHLSGYKVPRSWVRVDACRRLPTGKADYAWARAVATGEAPPPAAHGPR